VKPELLLNFIVVGCGTLSLLTWMRWLWLLWHGEPLVAGKPRRHVRWRGIDLVVIVAFYIAAQAVCVSAGMAWLEAGDDSPLDVTTVEWSTVAWSEEDSAAPPAESSTAAPTPLETTAEGGSAADGLDTSHPIVQLLRQRHNRGTLLLVLLSGVLVAPLFEEFLFRALIQSWLAARERLLARTFSFIGDLPPGALAITTIAFVFAALHARGGDDPFSVPTADELVALLAGNAVGNLLTLTFAIIWLVRNCRVGPRDLGFDLGHLGGDLYLGISGFAAVIAPAYALQLTLMNLLPNLAVATDPIPLFLFGLLVGYLYFRTNRLLPSVTAHVCFNALGFLLISLQLPA
jgi:membrane protease YdiL (CAAX protease family)